MSKFKQSDNEKQLNRVLKHQDDRINSLHNPSLDRINETIDESEKLLQTLGYVVQLEEVKKQSGENTNQKVIVVHSWEQLVAEAEKSIGRDVDLESLFTEEELKSNELALRMIRGEYEVLHKLDQYDVAICVAAGTIGAVIDIILIGIPKFTSEGLKAAPLSDFVRTWFKNRFPAEEMDKLSRMPKSKVPYDAQDNRNTKEDVEGLSAYFHRLLSLGHDPLLGFIVGVFDILNGSMTTIDKNGVFTSQVMENYADRKEVRLFAAIAKQVMHLKSDITTSMGLPAPLMGLFNMLQFGSIGQEEQTIAEIVQGMYYEGYDFVHFCSQSISVMIIEVIIRIAYAVKRIKEGHAVKDSLPFSINPENLPKLGTMLFVGHSLAVAANTGKIYFIKNPLAINYPQWLAFAKYSYHHLKWVLINKPEARAAYVTGKLTTELENLYTNIDLTFMEFSKESIVVLN